jgi:hypothetical protein
MVYRDIWNLTAQAVSPGQVDDFANLQLDASGDSNAEELIAQVLPFKILVRAAASGVMAA